MAADSKTGQALKAAKEARAAQAAARTVPATGGAVVAPATAAQMRHATLRYATLRIAVFVVSLAVLWGAVALTGHVVTGNGVLYLMMGALLVSGVASFFLLNKQRDAMSTQVTARADRITRRVAANAAMEDED